jgi:hypothetical protein
MSIKGLKQLGQSKPKMPAEKQGRSPIDEEFDDSDDNFGQKRDNIFDMDRDLEDYELEDEDEFENANKGKPNDISGK